MDEVMIQYNEIDTELHQTSVLILLIGISHEIEKHRLEASIPKPKMSCSKSVMSDISNIVDISAFHCNRFFFIGSFLYRRVVCWHGSEISEYLPRVLVQKLVWTQLYVLR